MPMKARMTAKDYLNTLSPEQLKKISTLKSNPDLCMFLAEPCSDAVKNASFAAECQDLGIPTEFTNSPESIHYLVVAIINQMKGNA